MRTLFRVALLSLAAVVLHRRLNLVCLLLGHEPKPFTWRTETREEGVCRYCGVDIARTLEPPATPSREPSS